MSATRRPPAITGVSSVKNGIVTVVYPSIAATVPGRLLGLWLDCIPLKIGGIKLSHLLFGLPAALLALPGFLMQRLTGAAYALTTRSVQVRGCLSNRMWREVPFSEIDRVAVRQIPGQAFYPAGEIDLIGKSGDVLLTLSGVLRAEVFRQLILEALTANRQVAASLRTIESRQPASA